MAPRKARATKETKPVETPVETHTALVEQTPPPKRELILEGDPDAQLEFASKAARALMSIVSKKAKPVMIQGKQYLEYGDWQVLARFYGATVEIEWTKELPNNKGYEARALVKRNGEVISSAEGMCTRDERRWERADDYAVRSMAQTRTAAKALRNAFGWVAELAGYSATPAEEMPRDIYQTSATVTYDEPTPPTRREPVIRVDDEQPKQYKVLIAGHLSRLGHDVRGMEKEEADAVVLKLTGLPMIDSNHEEIESRLHVLLRERDNGA